MKKVLKGEIPGYEIKIIPEKESGYYAVRFPDFPGIATGGYTLKEALKNGEEALALTVETMRMHKMPIPKPRALYSGQFNVRVPKELHRELVIKAEEEGVSLNAVVTYLLTKALKKRAA